MIIEDVIVFFVVILVKNVVDATIYSVFTLKNALHQLIINYNDAGIDRNQSLVRLERIIPNPSYLIPLKFSHNL